MFVIDVLATSGTFIGLVGASSLLIQARRLMRLGTACEISLPIRALTVTGYAIWLGYGIAIGDLPLILVDAAGLVGAIVLIQITVRLRRVQPCSVPEARGDGDGRIRMPALHSARSS